VGPHSLQAGQQVLKLGQFDLHHRLTGASASSEDVENEFGAIQNPNPDAILEGLPLSRREFVVEDYEIGVGSGHGLPKLIYLALPDVKA
jgi:hypothetical protein